MRVLAPVQVLEGDTVSGGLVDLLASVDVTVLGYHILPEQTPPDQARAQFEDRATSALTDLVTLFEEAGGDADHRLVFTSNRRETIDRVAAETGARAYAIGGATGEIDDLLVSLTGDIDPENVLSFLEALIDGRAIRVTLLATGESADTRLADASERLTAAGIETSVHRGEGDPFDALVDAVAGHDAVVMSERAPSLSSLLFGEESERVAAASAGPVLVVRPDAE